MYNKLADCHIHTEFSWDAKHPVEEMLLSGIDKGLGYMCFTDHKDLDPNFEGTSYYDDSAYTDSVNAVQKKYSDKIEVFKGIELDCQIELMKDARDFLDTYSFDYVLASVHVVRHEFTDAELFYKYPPELIYREYLDEVLALSQTEFFDILGHADYVKRFGDSFLKFDPQAYGEMYEKILKNIIAGGKGIELNCSGWRHDPEECYPSEFILTMYKKLGGELITLGSDAHNPHVVAYSFERGAELLRKVGFDGVYYFRERKPVKIKFER
ncbi:MAG: histidinol-phosphatase HisJ family protein [Firmicutes bacterium]|nr:histidinol-phosphatase HisJ family protein [Bacillota bacterium]